MPASQPLALRQGLPRIPGGPPWPPAVAAQEAKPVPTASTEPTPAAAPQPRQATQQAQLRQGLPRIPGGPAWPPAAAIEVVPEPAAEATTKPTTKPTAEPAATPQLAPTAAPTPTPAPSRPRRRWPALAFGALAALCLLVLGARWFVGTEAGADFLARYEGHAPLPEGAPVGLPAWLGWSHFFNAFLMVLIIRSGLQVRREAKPPAYWQSRRGSSGTKVSLTIWLHQSLDLLWVINGAAFFVLLFATGQWQRIVPTTWEVFPHAVSAGLQYLSLDWPTDNGWVYYNGLQQLTYFVTVFLAAPLAILTGVRMSTLWPSALNRYYPAAVARALHFPTMLYFLVFIVCHVALVFATGALRNLNHVFAARDDHSVIGLVVFLLAVAFTAAAWLATARPALLAPVARLFGTVTSR